MHRPPDPEMRSPAAAKHHRQRRTIVAESNGPQHPIQFRAHALTEPPRSVDRGPAIAGLLGGSRRNQRTTAGRRENSDGSRSAMTPPPAKRRR
jgi:hypothetical protein